MLWHASQDRRELLGLYPVFGMGWLYFYGYMAFDAVRHLGVYLPASATELGEFIALLCLTGVVLGWKKGVGAGYLRGRRHQLASPWNVNYNYTKLWWIGLAMLIVGLYGFRSFSESGRAFNEVLGYWYMSGHLVYPGATLCLIAFSKLPTLRSAPRLIGFIALLSVAMFPFISGARRGPFFTLVMVCLFTPALCGWFRPRPFQVFAVIAGAGAVMMFMVLARSWVYATEDRSEGWSQAAKGITLEHLLTFKSKSLDDNEFAYHCGAVATADQLGLIQYGTGDLSLLVHWIPRRWWPNKPEVGRGWMEAVEWQIPRVMGWSMINGGAIGGVASSFHQYGYLAPLFWFVLAYLFGTVYSRALFFSDPRMIASWVGIVASMHWLIAQSFHDAFVPACIYQAAPWLVFRYVKSAEVVTLRGHHRAPHHPRPGDFTTQSNLS